MWPFKKKADNSTLKSPDDLLLDALTGGNTSSAGVNVTDTKAMQVAAVNSCVRVLSTAFAALPLHLKRTDGQVTENAKDHPLYYLLHSSPNDEMIAYNHRQVIMDQLLYCGTSFNELARDGRGRVREITPLCGTVKVDRDSNGRLIYDFYDGKTNRLIQDRNIWRITGYTKNGIIGLSPLAVARETIGQAIAANDFGGSVFKNGGKLSGLLKVQQKLDPEQQKDILRAWNKSFSGSSNAGKTGLLHNGADFVQASMSLVDAQFLETMKFNRSQIAGIYGVPPHMIGDLERATFSNIEHQSIDFVIYSLLPYIVNFEQTVMRDLLAPSERLQYQAKFSVDGLLRGDSKARAEFYKAMHNMGALERNEIRAFENLNPIEGGDNTYMQINMGKIDDDGNIGQQNETTQQTSESDQDEPERSQAV